MQTIEVTRDGNLSIGDQIAEMRRWLDSAGSVVSALQAVRILNARVTFRITFETSLDAARFINEFGEVR